MAFVSPNPSCRACSGGPQPGTVALSRALLEKYTYTKNVGIYNCRDVAGTNVRSQHSCGRAFDQGVPVLAGGAANTALGYPIVTDLRNNGTALGISRIIYNRAIYDASSPNGRYYGGVHPHYDHLHIEQSPAAAATLTYTQAAKALGIEEDMETTKGIQRSLNAAGYVGANGKALKVDGIWGANSEFALTNSFKDAKGSGLTAKEVDAIALKRARGVLRNVFRTAGPLPSWFSKGE